MSLKFFVIYIFLLQGCLAKRAPYRPTMAPEPTIQVNGQLIDSSGNGLDGAGLFLESSAEIPLTTSQGGGMFSMSISNSAIERASNSIQNESQWYVYSHRKGSAPLAGVSIAQKTLGLPRVLDLGRIPMLPVSSFSGRVYRYLNNGISPVEGATVTLARSKAVTAEDGSFKLNDLPSSRLPLQIKLDGFETLVAMVDIKPGQDQVSQRSFVLFTQASPEAVLVPKPWARNPNLVAGSFERSFEVYANNSVKFIRYHHDRTKFDATSSTSSTATNSSFQWRKITDSISYTFPQIGLNRLWYQVANEEKSVVSDLRESSVMLNPCDGLNRLIINNGEPTTTKRQVNISFSELPVSAYRLKLAETIEGLANVAWKNVQTQTSFVFEANPNRVDVISGGQNQGPIVSTQTGSNIRQIFAQIETLEGECPVLTSSVILQPFPPTTQPMLVLNGGLPVSESLIVSATIPNIPPNAVEMRIAEIQGSGTAIQLNLAPWMNLRSQIPLLLQNAQTNTPVLQNPGNQGQGFKTVALQFRDADGLTSPIYSSNIQVIPPQNADFTVSYAQLNPLVPAQPSRYLNLDLFPPSTAVAFRYVEVVPGAGNNIGTNVGNNFFFQQPEILIQPWLSLTPRVPVYARGEGLRVFVLQYQLSDGETVAIRREKFVDVSPATVGGFLINGGAALTLYPFVKLYIAPPIDVEYMAATDLNAVSLEENWVQVAPTLDYRLPQQGPNTVMLRFRDNNFSVTDPGAIQTIFYDPFPPFPLGLKPLVINNDAATTTSTNVTLTITAHESARSYRISESPNFLNAEQFTQIPTTPRINLPGISWEITQFDAPFILSPDAGPKILYVQFKNDTGVISSAILDSITLQP